ncbi:MAG: NUDIX domain-containing protein [Mariprofundaceae bacterium]|nr:NUDIX domain-containing protein [Mariprofundaceae bacterium]
MSHTNYISSMDYKLKSKRPLHRGFFHLDSYSIEHERFDGGTLHIEREHLERGNAVAVLLYDAESDDVLLIEQFRIGAAVRKDNAWLIEVVAGMIDEGEDAQAAGRREAIEEAGYAPTSMQFLGKYYTTPGGSSEHITLFLGLVNRHEPIGGGGGMACEHEDIRHFWLPRAQAMQWIFNGRINSGAPMLALLLAFSDRVSACREG